jgi:hypothetical protein
MARHVLAKVRGAGSSPVARSEKKRRWGPHFFKGPYSRVGTEKSNARR